jgi:hypothetical protein
VHLNSDYSYAIGSVDFSDPDGNSESGSTFRWLEFVNPLNPTSSFTDTFTYKYAITVGGETSEAFFSSPLKYPGDPASNP